LIIKSLTKDARRIEQLRERVARRHAPDRALRPGEILMNEPDFPNPSYTRRISQRKRVSETGVRWEGCNLQHARLGVCQRFPCLKLIAELHPNLFMRVLCRKPPATVRCQHVRPEVLRSRATLHSPLPHNMIFSSLDHLNGSLHRNT
jgi:hypothetical protein